MKASSHSYVDSIQTNRNRIDLALVLDDASKQCCDELFEQCGLHCFTEDDLYLFMGRLVPILSHFHHPQVAASPSVAHEDIVYTLKPQVLAQWRCAALQATAASGFEL